MRVHCRLAASPFGSRPRSPILEREAQLGGRASRRRDREARRAEAQTRAEQAGRAGVDRHPDARGAARAAADVSRRQPGLQDDRAAEPGRARSPGPSPRRSPGCGRCSKANAGGRWRSARRARRPRSSGRRRGSADHVVGRARVGLGDDGRGAGLDEAGRRSCRPAAAPAASVPSGSPGSDCCRGVAEVVEQHDRVLRELDCWPRSAPRRSTDARRRRSPPTGSGRSRSGVGGKRCRDSGSASRCRGPCRSPARALERLLDRGPRGVGGVELGDVGRVAAGRGPRRIGPRRDSHPWRPRTVRPRSRPWGPCRRTRPTPPPRARRARARTRQATIAHENAVSRSAGTPAAVPVASVTHPLGTDHTY